jgi:hypothetical protein
VNAPAAFEVRSAVPLGVRGAACGPVRRAIRRGPRGRRLGTRTEGGPGPGGHEARVNGARHQVRTEVRHTAHVTDTDTDTDTDTQHGPHRVTRPGCTTTGGRAARDTPPPPQPHLARRTTPCHFLSLQGHAGWSLGEAARLARRE